MVINHLLTGMILQVYVISTPPTQQIQLLGCPWKLDKLVRIASKLIYFTYLLDLQPTYIGVIIHLLSTSRTSQ